MTNSHWLTIETASTEIRQRIDCGQTNFFPHLEQ